MWEIYLLWSHRVLDYCRGHKKKGVTLCGLFVFFISIYFYYFDYSLLLCLCQSCHMLCFCLFFVSLKSRKEKQIGAQNATVWDEHFWCLQCFAPGQAWHWQCLTLPRVPLGEQVHVLAACLRAQLTVPYLTTSWGGYEDQLMLKLFGGTRCFMSANYYIQVCYSLGIRSHLGNRWVGCEMYVVKNYK